MAEPKFSWHDVRWSKLSVNQRGLVIAVAFVLVVSGYQFATSRSSTASGGTSVPAARPAHGTGTSSLSGSDDQTGPPFSLGGGDYTLNWSATNSDGMGIDEVFFVFLYDANGRGRSVVDVQVPDGSRNGTEYVYGLPPGTYHLKVITQTGWQVSISGS